MFLGRTGCSLAQAQRLLLAELEFLGQLEGLARELFDVDVFEGQYLHLVYEAVGTVDVPHPHVDQLEFKIEVAAGIFALANSSDMFLLLRAREVGVPQEQIPLLWAGISLITTVFGAPLSALSDTFGRKRFILIAWIAFAIFYIAMGMPSISVYQIFGLFVIYGLFKAATEGVEKALVADLAPSGLAGTAFGWFNLITGLMLFPASYIFGWIYESIAPLYAFVFSGGCALAAFILMACWVFNKGSDKAPN